MLIFNNLKLIYTYLLLVLFSFQTFETALIAFNFKINQNFFASICTNKDKPALNCDGKCHLKKQIQKSEDDKSNKETINYKKEVQTFISQELTLIPDLPNPILTNSIIRINFIHPRCGVSDIFHPPQQF